MVSDLDDWAEEIQSPEPGFGVGLSLGYAGVEVLVPCQWDVQ